MNVSLVSSLSRIVTRGSSVSAGIKGKALEASTASSRASRASFVRLYHQSSIKKSLNTVLYSIPSSSASSSLAKSRTNFYGQRRVVSGLQRVAGSIKRTMFIRTESTPNPDSVKFMPEQQMLEPGQSIDFENAMSAARSPLAKMLFRNDSVQRVFIGSTFVTVTKDEDADWEDIKPIIFADLTEFFASGEEVLLGEVPISDTTILETDSEDVALIKTLIETRIRPSIQDDGGDLTFKGFIDGVVFLQLQGSCTSCPSSSVTLKSGIEKMLKHWSSSVISVIAVESDEEWQRISNGGSSTSTGDAAEDAESDSKNRTSTEGDSEANAKDKKSESQKIKSIDMNSVSQKSNIDEL